MTSFWLMDRLRRAWLRELARPGHSAWDDPPFATLMADTLPQRGYSEEQTYGRYNWVEDNLVPAGRQGVTP